MRVRLAACGVRAISNLVDVTNYVMLETGHPLHAFDLDKLRGRTSTCGAPARGERMTTLDGVDRPLQAGDIVIADDRGRWRWRASWAARTARSRRRRRAVLLEAATFDPRGVRRTAKRLGLHSEASHRFERGVDAERRCRTRAARAATMLARAGGGGTLARRGRRSLSAAAAAAPRDAVARAG